MKNVDRNTEFKKLFYLRPSIKITMFNLQDVIVVSGQCTTADQCNGSCDGPLLSGSDEGNKYDGTSDMGSENVN